MGFPWHKVGKALETGLSLGALVEPHLAMVADLMHTIEGAAGDAPGRDKKATVEAMADAFLSSQLADFVTTPDQLAELRRARSVFIDAYKAEMHAALVTKAAAEQVMRLIAAFKAGSHGA